MKIGVVLPQTEIGNDPAAIKAYGEAVEGMGFTHVLVFDHVLGANPERPGGWKGPYTYRHAFHEPFVLFGFLAAAWSCRSARRRWSPSSPPRWTCSRAGGCGSASPSAGTRSSSRRSARTSGRAAAGSRSRSR